MGCCFSSAIATSSSRRSTHRTAAVVGVGGSLTEYSVPVPVSKALGIDHLTCFLCNSDSLSFDARVPPMRSDDFLEVGQIYFVLPKSKLGAPLSGADMAGLAVRASSALALASDKKGAKKQKVMISGGDATTGAVTRQGAVGRSASSWAKALRRSMRRTLSAIEEADD